jgi:hypothetical protein
MFLLVAVIMSTVAIWLYGRLARTLEAPEDRNPNVLVTREHSL